MKFFSQQTLFFISVAAAFFLIFYAIAAFQGHTLSANDEIKTEYMSASYSINISDPAELVGDADYVFVGKVDKLAGTTYKYPVMMEDEAGNKVIEATAPYADYYVTVYENIKGELVSNQSIPVQKSGGISKDGKSCFLFENDTLPEAGGIYIFYAYAQSADGSLLVAGEKSTVAIKSVKSAEKDSFKDSAEYLEAVEGFKNQKETNRERAIATYDVRNQ